MKKSRRCPECDSSSIYTTTVGSGGGYSSDLLPGTHPWYKEGTMEIYICTKCGYFRYYVPENALSLVSKSAKFRKHS